MFFKSILSYDIISLSKIYRFCIYSYIERLFIIMFCILGAILKLKVLYLDGKDLKKVLLGSLDLLSKYKSEINNLNVFPVPDGDTGTNLYLTLLGAVEEINKIDVECLDKIADAAARGSLMNARGNSGVILSQMFLGFANALKGKPTAVAEDFANALEEGAKAAYDAVSNPVEGTVLTVLNQSAKAAKKSVNQSSDLLRLLLAVYLSAVSALNKTPEQLKVLKDAGVVDAGAKGWVVILQGILYALKGADLNKTIDQLENTSMYNRHFQKKSEENTEMDIEHTYCTEFLLKGSELNIDQIKADLVSFGDCLMVVGTDSTLKIHIHTNHPGTVLETCIKRGCLDRINISNMRLQHKNEENTTLNKNLAVVSIGVGDGICEMMKSYGADIIVSGGQTMNPSVEDILKAIEKAPSTEVILLPNNKNIIMAANNAAKVSDKNVTVIPTVSMPHGIACLLALDLEKGLNENVKMMEEILKNIRVAEVTVAVRDVCIDGQDVRKGDIIGIIDDKIVYVADESCGVLKEVVKQLAVDDVELITIYYGSEISIEEAEKTKELLTGEFEDLEIEMHYGGQPFYHYIISAE